MEFSRQEYWSGLPLPSPGDLPDARTELSSPTLQTDSLLTESPGKPFTRYKGPYSQIYEFSSSYVWVWELEHGEHWALKSWCLWTVVLKKTLRVPWTARRSNQSILKEINPEYSLEGPMVKLKFQYFDNLMGGADSLEKTLVKGKTEGRRRGWQRMRWLDGIIDSTGRSLNKLQEKRKPSVLLQSMRSSRVRHSWATEQDSRDNSSFLSALEKCMSSFWFLWFLIRN